MRFTENTENVEGRIFQHSLELKVTGNNSKHPGTPFITGNIDIATSDDDMNIIQVHYTYVTEKTAKGARNITFENLKRIMEEGKTISEHGHDEATQIRTSPSIALNDFYPSGSNEVVSTPRNEGGFVTILNKKNVLNENEAQRATFKADVVLNSMSVSEDGTYATIRGAAFNFRGDILPMNFIIRGQNGINYFEDLNMSPNEPVYTKIWGKVTNKTVTQKVEIEVAFGDNIVDSKPRSVREWEIVSAAKIPYDFTEEDAAAIKKALADREVMLADTKRRRDEWEQNRAAAPTTPQNNAPAAPQIATGAFNF